MKKKIVILGSTGSIGQNTFKIIEKNKKDFEILLLSTNKNITKIFNEAKKLNVKNIIINNFKKYKLAEQKFKNLNIKIFNKFEDIEKTLKKKKFIIQ